MADDNPPELARPKKEAPAATRVFRVDDGAGVVVLLRTLYQVKDVSAQAQDRSVTIRAAEPILVASEALLRELKLLAEPSPHAKR